MKMFMIVTMIQQETYTGMEYILEIMLLTYFTTKEEAELALGGE